MKLFAETLLPVDQLPRDLLRQDGNPVAIALARPHRHLPAIEVDVLHPQIEQFAVAQTGPVLQLGGETTFLRQIRKDRRDLADTQHDGYALRGLPQPHVQMDLVATTDLAEEKDQRVQRLFLGRVGDFLLRHQPREPLARLALVHHCPSIPDRAREGPTQPA